MPQIRNNEDAGKMKRQFMGANNQFTVRQTRTASMARRSLGYFFTMIFSGMLRMPGNRLGLPLRLEDRGTYKVFRETLNTQADPEIPAVIVVGFRLRAIGSNPFLHYLFQRICIITTPFWCGLPGFYIKLWMVDPLTKDYAGIYEWNGKEKAQTYLDMLIPVLQALSCKGSVWYTLHPGQNLETYLKEANGRSSRTRITGK